MNCPAKHCGHPIADDSFSAYINACRCICHQPGPWGLWFRRIAVFSLSLEVAPNPANEVEDFTAGSDGTTLPFTLP